MIQKISELKTYSIRRNSLRILLTFLFLFLTNKSHTQQKREIFVKTIDQKITVDGRAQEESWNFAKEVGDFTQWFPSDSAKATNKTFVKALRDNENIYLLIKSVTSSKKYVIPSLRRDYQGRAADNVSFIFDTFNDNTNAYFFGVTPAGTQRESLVFNGGNDYGRDTDSSWDVKWECESEVYDDYILNEVKIPIKFLNFPEGSNSWGFNIYRFDSNTNERTVWSPVSRNQMIINLAFLGKMIFEDPLEKSMAPLAFIPYLNTIKSKDFEKQSKSNNLSYGGDIKVPIGNGLNLDLTLNPDFSQVEVDDQVVNLTRFEIRLPEKRQFFIQNSDLFSNYGDSRDGRPFFSRRIGVAKDLDGNNIQNKIVAGARLSGKIDENWRIGFLHMVTDEDIKNQIPSNNNTVFSLQKKMFSRSNLSLIILNRENTKDYDFTQFNDKFNRLIGLDYNLASNDNKYVGKFYFHKSFKPDSNRDDDDESFGGRIVRNTRNNTLELGGSFIGEDFKSDLGFVRRTDLFKVTPKYKLKFYPNRDKLIQVDLDIGMWSYYRPNDNFKNSDRTISPSINLRFKNQSNFDIRLYNRNTYLYNDFDPTGLNPENPIPAGKTYKYSSIKFNYRSNEAKKFYYEIEPEFGEFYTGTKYSIENRFNLRFQPYMTTTLSINYDHIDLGNAFPSENIWLVRPKIDFTFTKNLFWSSYIQFSSQSENLGINSRLQWRFAPLSDLYIVYNDNYFIENSLVPRLRSLNLKLTYWLNI
tara:strand:+ start:2668 stop:4923 length:2256 start_codon:yes stop_codon:yes gene_type:complete